MESLLHCGTRLPTTPDNIADYKLHGVMGSHEGGASSSPIRGRVLQLWLMGCLGQLLWGRGQHPAAALVCSRWWGLGPWPRALELCI